MKEIDDEEVFLAALNARMRQFVGQVAAGDIPASHASFELVAAIFSAHEGELDPQKLAESYPVQAWREDRVEVPRGLLRPLIDAWMRYRGGQPGLTIGEAMGIEGGGQGKLPTVQAQRAKDRDQRLSNKVVLDLAASNLEGRGISQDAAILGVVEAERKAVEENVDNAKEVSYETVRKAFRKYGKATCAALEDIGVKTSGR